MIVLSGFVFEVCLKFSLMQCVLKGFDGEFKVVVVEDKVPEF